MKGSLNLGKIAGIKLSVHWTFSLLLIYIVISHFSAGETAIQIAWSVFFILSIFLTVFLHELGHALAAKRYHIITKDITLLPIGGIARLERIPEKPVEELVVAIAGPLVNLLIALVTWFFIDFPASDQLAAELSGAMNSSNFLLNFFLVNVWLSVFNLIPAFPMDGGRVLRAALAYFIPRHKATVIAARIGQLLAIGFVLLGFYSNPFLIFIGLFIMFGAQAEMEMVTTNYLLKGNLIGEITMHHYETVQASDPVSRAVELLLDGTGKSFLVMQDGQAVGTLNRNEIIRALTEKGKDTPISGIMNSQLLSFEHTTPIEQVYLKMNEARQELAVIRQNGEITGVVDTENVREFVLVKSALQAK